MSEIREDTYYRMMHVTGPGCVLVSLRFGREPKGGPSVTIRAAREALIEPTMDVDHYVAEVMAGVADASSELGIAIGLEEIEIIPDDSPTSGQLRHCGRLLAKHYFEKKRPNQPVEPTSHSAPRCDSRLT